MDPADRFGANLYRARKDAGLSQEALAARSHIHATEISRLEKGNREPRLGTIVKLAHGLDLPVAELVEGLDRPKPIVSLDVRGGEAEG